ncbi:MAG: Crp/Fnr family transcriptional regulator [Devosia sp.]
MKGLPPGDLALLDPLEPVALPLRYTLEPADMRIEQVYFIDFGVASVVAQTAGQREIEVGVIGLEGMTGHALLLADDQSPFETFMQVEGTGYRIPAERLVGAINQSENLRLTLLRYARAFNLQVAATSVANGSSKLEERLARWLLMVADRVGGSFAITHAFLATMLAVRRPGVTLALQILEGRGLIRSSRGNVMIIDREGLIEASNGAYGLAEREQSRLFNTGNDNP